MKDINKELTYFAKELNIAVNEYLEKSDKTERAPVTFDELRGIFGDVARHYAKYAEKESQLSEAKYCLPKDYVLSLGQIIFNLQARLLETYSRTDVATLTAQLEEFEYMNQSWVLQADLAEGRRRAEDADKAFNTLKDVCVRARNHSEEVEARLAVAENDLYETRIINYNMKWKMNELKQSIESLQL